MKSQGALLFAAGFVALVLTSVPGAADSNRGNGQFGFAQACRDLVAEECANQSDEVIDACVSSENVCANAEKTGNPRLEDLCTEKQDLFSELCNASSPSGAFLDD